nr:MAG TPA: hypothetical protein [Caudoviricetes sp.]
MKRDSRGAVGFRRQTFLVGLASVLLLSHMYRKLGEYRTFCDESRNSNSIYLLGGLRLAGIIRVLL